MLILQSEAFDPALSEHETEQEEQKVECTHGREYVCVKFLQSNFCKYPVPDRDSQEFIKFDLHNADALSILGQQISYVAKTCARQYRNFLFTVFMTHRSTAASLGSCWCCPDKRIEHLGAFMSINAVRFDHPHQFSMTLNRSSMWSSTAIFLLRWDYDELTHRWALGDFFEELTPRTEDKLPFGGLKS